MRLQKYLYLCIVLTKRSIMQKLNVLSLFDGMSCGQIALERAGIEVNQYFASEIDKPAIKVTQSNYPNTIQIGDVTKVRYEAGILYTESGEYNVGKIDLVIGGSPCQGFSFAGKQLDFDDPRSALFFEWLRICNEVCPEYFLLENVKMKKESENVITNKLGIEPVEINSALVSAQNRKRLYWTNIPGIRIPEDKGIFLKHIVGFESEFPSVSEVYEEIEKFTKRDFLVSISKTGRIRPYRLDVKKSGISEVGTLVNPNDKSCTIIASHAPKTYKSGPFRVYELNRNECERLQTVPQNYTLVVSEKQAKKMLGNGWTVDVIAHIFKGIAEVQNAYLIAAE